jgi:hypothetical protein
MFAFAALVLAAAVSTPVVAPENLSPAMGVAPTYAMPGPSSTAVRDGDGFLLAFTAEANTFPQRARVFVTRLDAFGKMTGDLRQMPVTNDGADAELPSIVAAPDGYYVGQMEMAMSPVGIVWHVKPDLPLPASPLTRLNGSPLFIRGDDGKFFTSAFDRIVEYSLDGALTAIAPNNNADDIVAIGGNAVPVAHVIFQPQEYCGLIECPPYSSVPGMYSIFVGARTLPSMWLKFDFTSNHGVGAATDGATILTAYYHGDPRVGGDVRFVRWDAATYAAREVPRPLGPFEGDPLQQPLRPAVAFDGVRYLVVWQTGHAIAAAAIDADGNVTPVALPHLGEETLPNVVAAGRGKFLLSYGAVRNGEWHLATRMVYFELGRRPVARR